MNARPWCGHTAAVLMISLTHVACGILGTDLPELVALGTWGGVNAGVIVSEDKAHVHIGCNRGDFMGRIAVDQRGGFTAMGTYYTNARGPSIGDPHPARFSGTVKGPTMTLTVTLMDDGQVFGPVTVIRGETPRMMDICPICSR